jgi:hypothetical protein
MQSTIVLLNALNSKEAEVSHDASQQERGLEYARNWRDDVQHDTAITHLAR